MYKQTVHLRQIFAMILTAGFFILLSCQERSLNIYVSPVGLDSNDGTENSPYKSIEKAILHINSLDIGTGESVNIFLREGIYAVDSTIEIENQQNARISISAYNDEEVMLSGGLKIETDAFQPLTDSSIIKRIIDQNIRGNILKADLKALGIDDYGVLRQHGFSTAILPAPMELFVNGEPMTIARFPNQGKMSVSEVIKDCSRAIDRDFSFEPGIIGYDSDRPDLWTSAKDIWIWGYFRAGFADDNLGIRDIDTVNNAIHLNHAHMFGMMATDTTDEWGGRIVGYQAYNLLEEIDQPGEYYIDRDKGILYLYPPKDFTKSEIILSNTEDPLIAIENSKNITFTGIKIGHGRGMGVYFENSDSILFDRCTFKNLGTVAAMFGKGVSGIDYPIHEFTGELTSRTIGNLKAHVYENTGFFNHAGTNCGIINSKIYNTGTGAVILSGGKRSDLIPGNNFVENCEIYNFNRWNKTYCAGITLYGVGNSIENCYLHDAPHQGIAIFGNEHLIQYNHLHKMVMDVHDNGSIYIGRNPSERGNVIRNNLFTEIGVEGFKNCAIHLDDMACATVIENNVFYKASKFDFGDILINGGNDNIIRNNVFIDGSQVLWIESPKMAIPEDIFSERYGKNGLTGNRLYKDIDITKDVWKKQYPDFQPYDENGNIIMLTGNQFENNYIDCDRFIISKHNIDSSVFAVYRNNYFAGGEDEKRQELIDGKGDFISDTIDLSEMIPGFTPIVISQSGLK